MLTIPDLIEKTNCFVWGHDWNRNGVCENCGERKKQ